MSKRIDDLENKVGDIDIFSLIKNTVPSGGTEPGSTTDFSGFIDAIEQKLSKDKSFFENKIKNIETEIKQVDDKNVNLRVFFDKLKKDLGEHEKGANKMDDKILSLYSKVNLLEIELKDKLTDQVENVTKTFNKKFERLSVDFGTKEQTVVQASGPRQKNSRVFSYENNEEIYQKLGQLEKQLMFVKQLLVKKVLRLSTLRKEVEKPRNQFIKKTKHRGIQHNEN